METAEPIPSSELGESDPLNGGKEKAKEPFWANITLEPMWLGLFISAGFDVVVFKNLYIERACNIDLGYPKNVCYVEGPLDSFIEVEAQKVISSISVTTSLISGVITCLLVIFLGSWSDASGRRKPLMLISVGGGVVSSLSTLVALQLQELSTVWVIFLRVIPLAFGGFALLGLSAFSYLGDICYKTLRNPTVVMGRNGAAMYISMVLGSYLAPILYRKIGFSGITALSFSLQVFSLLYVYIVVNDVSVKDTFPNILDLSLPINAFKCLFKKRDGYKRQIIMIMILIPATNTLIGTNEVAIRYLYLRNTFKWSELEYGTLLAVRLSINAVGIMLIVKIFKEKLKMRDEVIGFIGAVSELSDAIVFMSIKKPWVLFAMQQLWRRCIVLFAC